MSNRYRMEAKLREYRARRRRQELVENTKEKLEVTKKKITDILVPKLFNNMGKENKDEEVVLVSFTHFYVKPSITDSD